MTFGNILEALILGPLTILFETIFELANVVTNNPGLSIILLSLAFNILVLPLYKRADDMQEEARQVEDQLREGVANIKKHFSGDERMMILQTYYNQNHYKPTHALKGSVSLLLQVPFFIAAYRFLSSLVALQGASLGPIANLGAPDGLLVIGGLSINLLPILMTLINVVSGVIYLKGFPLKTKVQTYGLALFFLVFLYNSPAGLVFYWTLNNVFSLCKSAYNKLHLPKTVLYAVISAAGVGIMGFGALVNLGSFKRKVIVIGCGLLLQAVWLLPTMTRRMQSHPITANPNKKLFLAGSLFLTVLVGAVVSTTYIAASPQEYVNINHFYHPLWFVVSSFCMAAGTFLIWMRVFYWLAKPTTKVMFERVVCILSAVMLINYMFFGQNLGIVSSTLKYQDIVNFSTDETLINLLVITLTAVILYWIVKRWSKGVTRVLALAVLVLSLMCGKNVLDIAKSVNAISVNPTALSPQFELSQNGQNVVVIMLDRAMGSYVPYILNEKPELKEQFDGFTYYSNTISFGQNTNFGVPPLMGGYEYTPVEINKADTRPLVEKHNEALKVMPVLFAENGYDVTVCDPSYANYQWIPDLSIYEDYPEIDAYITKGRFNSEEQQEYLIYANLRNFFYFSLMKCMPVATQSIFYHGGSYNRPDRVDGAKSFNQIATGTATATGIDNGFLDAYNVLQNMPEMTHITDEEKGSFLFLQNQITHNSALLQTPDYLPTDVVDNTEYDAAHADCYTLEDGSTLDLSAPSDRQSYHCNMAALLQVANWLDYLRENDLYDNTRIILVSDHGSSHLVNAGEWMTEPGFTDTNYRNYFPLLMVKDFNSEGFTVSEEFMTNADVPTLATADVIDNPTNPFTGNPINSDEKTAHDQLLVDSDDWQVNKNNGNTFLPCKWISVSENIHDKENWEYCSDKIVLKEHELP